MIGKNSPQELTEADWALHRQEIGELRAHLFRDRSPQSLYVIGEADSIAPSVVVVWYPEPPKRTLLRGGLRFKLHFPGAHGLSHCSIQHWSDDLYWLHAGYVDYRGASYSRFSLTVAHGRLPGCFVASVETMAREYAMHTSTRGS
jgi:hypothetical protein